MGIFIKRNGNGLTTIGYIGIIFCNMGKNTLREIYGEYAKRLLKGSIAPRIVTDRTVFQQANLKNRAIVHEILSDCVLPNSSVINLEHLETLARYSREEGQACLILMEHYSNFDLPGLCYLLSMQGDGARQIDEQIVAMSASKLNEESDVVLAFSEGYSRIVIVPARRMAHMMASAGRKEQMRAAFSINRAASREIHRIKNEGRIILMFPAGTRYKPGDPDTKRILPIVYSYIRRFDYIVFVGIAGQVLHFNNYHDMTSDYVTKDWLFYAASEPYAMRDFRKEAKIDNVDGESKKQRIATAVEKKLNDMHAVAQRHYNICKNGHA